MFKFPRERITWDEAKNTSNRAKHAVRFEEALDVFADPWAIYAFDTDHSASEDRYRVVGIGGKLRILLVVFAVREPDHLRIISARKATRLEQQAYEKSR